MSGTDTSSHRHSTAAMDENCTALVEPLDQTAMLSTNMTEKMKPVKPSDEMVVTFCHDVPLNILCVRAVA